MFKRLRKMIPPLERTVDDTPFQVYEIRETNQQPKYEKDHFVSPIFGRNVKDEIVIPVMANPRRNLDNLDNFRTQPKLTKEERIRKYGTAYPEFDLVRGKNLEEALAWQNRTKTKATILTEEPMETPESETAAPPVHHPSYSPQTETTEPTPKEPVASSETPQSAPPVKEVKPMPQPDTFVRANAAASERYRLPPMSLFTRPPEQKIDLSESIERHIETLNQTFAEFGIGAKVHRHTQGPAVTRFEIVLDSGVNVRKITQIEANLKMALAATQIRIEAPIPGKSTVGIEVPNETVETVHFYDIINTSMYQKAAQALTIGLGLDIDGHPVYASIKSMPHGLIAGATGSGKSVCVNTILMSLLIKYKPNELKLVLVDPKMVELTNYNDIAHLLTPVITDAKAATAALRWLVEEMDRRFNVFAEQRVRDIDAYNVKHESDPEMHMPYIVVVIDELADLMMVSSQHVEDAIKRLTQKARACGIHLIVATQRPSTDVIKGTIKSNIPTRIAFSVSSHVDSQTIIDASGADKLLGRGDMLFLSNGQNKIRVQGAYITDADIEKVTHFIREQQKPNYLFDQEMLVKNIAESFERDELFEDVAVFVVEAQEASINKISRQFSIGFNRAQSIVEALEEAGIVSENLGSRAREVLVSEEEIGTLLRQLKG
ncbi:MAG: DUF87 domain-containing protein [Acholeplasmatales bacterium]|nr:MAG: DUF87 domain-containing protein [Acholeplasmatales bacterium]